MVKQRSVPTAALRILLIYVAVGISWIVLSSQFVHFQVDPAWQGAYEIAKGLLYVVVTGALLYVLIRKAFLHREELIQKLGEKDRSLSLALLAGRSGAYEWNLASGNVHWSESAANLPGVDELCSGCDIRSAVPIPEGSRNKQAYEEVIKAVTEGRHFAVVLESQSTDGKTCWYENRGERLMVDGQLGDTVVGVVSDISAQVEVQEKLQELSESLDAEVRVRTENLSLANRELQAFNQAVAHDLRSPLRAIHGFATLLMEEEAERLSKGGRETLERIVASSTRLAEMFDGLQKLGQVTSHEVADEVVNLSEIAAQAVKQVQTQQAGNGKAAVEITPNMTASADPRLVHLILQNLIENAFKYAARRDGTKIEVGQASRDGEQMFFVRDNGVGFRQDESEKLFDLFRRGKNSGGSPGQGIGLATVASAVRRMNGRVFAESSPGNGATFWFSFNP